MITPTHLAAAEDLLHLLNPLRLKENLRHVGSGLFSPRTYRGLDFAEAGGVRKGLGMFAKDVGHSLKGGFWDLPFKGTAIMTVPFAAYAASQAPEGVHAYAWAFTLIARLRPPSRGFMTNKFRIEGDVAFIYLYHRGAWLKTVLDAVDLPIVQSFSGRWGILRNSSGRYVCGCVSDPYLPSGRSTVLLHRWIVNPEPQSVVRHRDGDRLNNRRSNLFAGGRDGRFVPSQEE